MRRLITLLFALFSFLGSFAQELEILYEMMDTVAIREYTDEELALLREKRMEEMLPNTRALVFIDSLVVNKDDFLNQLRLTTEVGKFSLPDAVISHDRLEAETGQAAFVNSLGSAAFFSIADTLGVLRLNALYRNGGQWTDPQPIEELRNFTYQDYPFLCPDGSTLYFAASGIESIGGIDLFVTRYNEENHQFVRPQNLGFPYNSPANDYLLAIDEELGVGVLVSDRNQPEDKVCIYWFVEDGQRNIYDYDSEDEEAENIVREYAAISNIAATQEGHEEEVEKLRKTWQKALNAQSQTPQVLYTFIIDDKMVYRSLDQFNNDQARDLAVKWISAKDELAKLEAQQQKTRNDYAANRDESLIPVLSQLEKQLPKKRAEVRSLEKQFRAAEKQ